MKLRGAMLAGLALLSAGCGTMGGGNQMKNTVYETYHIVKGQGESVAKLNQTAAELTARLNDSDQQARALQSTLEENRVKLENVQRTLDNLAATLHRQMNLSPPVAGPGAPGSYPGSADAGLGGQITVSPPPAAGVLPPAPGPVAAPPTAPAVAAAGSPDADYRRAQQSYANKDYAAAVQQFDAILQRYPNHELCAPAQFWKGYALFNLGKYEEAVTELGKFRANYPSNDRVSHALYIEAMAHKGLGQAARADALLKEILEKYPNTAAWEKAKSELAKPAGN